MAADIDGPHASSGLWSIKIDGDDPEASPSFISWNKTNVQVWRDKASADRECARYNDRFPYNTYTVVEVDLV